MFSEYNLSLRSREKGDRALKIGPNLWEVYQ
jgi:hypothetical protein